jgi:NhaP-type Na+/H+ or K+/H+ antiporter
MYEIVAILTLAVFLYSTVSAKLESTRIGGAITFTVVGLLLGNSVLGLLDIELDGQAIGVLAELTLAFLLFADAAGADLKELSRQRTLPRRMLLLGLPGAVLLGIAVGFPLFGTSLGMFEIALLAAILAPTDAALGKAVVTDETVPNRIRTTFNFESGLNDGLCVPIFLAFLAFATQQAGDQGFSEIVWHLLLEEVGIGAGVGVLLAGFGCLAIRQGQRLGTIGGHWRPLMTHTCS